jgi:HAMP domain
MSIALAIRKKLSLKISLSLAVLMVLLTGAALVLITWRETAQLEELTLQKARLVASQAARTYGDMFDAAIDAGDLTVNKAFDRNYVEIKGYAWPDVRQKKFHTQYDGITDGRVLAFQDRILQQADFVFAVGNDENCYVPTHNSVFSKPLTGNPELDASNRTKRVFNSAVDVNACKTEEPSLLQIYTRDTGETMWDVASPIYVKGKHWGAFRVGVSMAHISQLKRSNVITLLLVFGAFTLITIGAIALLITRSMKPVVELTAAAEQIGLGESLDQPLKSAYVDEIGQLTKTLDRLRVSMKAAMARLGE